MLALGMLLLGAGCAVREQVVEQPLDGDTLALAWTYDAGGAVGEPPLRAGDVVVFVPAGGPLVALDVETGALRWQYDPPERVWDRAYASGGQLVFVGVEGGRLVALDARNGKVRWHKDLGINVQMSPLVADDVLYVPTTFVGPGLEQDLAARAKLFALAPDDGRELWSFESDNYILQTPFRHGDTVYVSGSFNAPREIEEGGHLRLYALSANDGRERWTYEADDGFVKALYATDSVVAFIAYQDFVSGIDAATGKLRWRRDTGNWVPAISGEQDVLYFGSANTVVHALNMDDGKAVWQYNIEEGTFNYVLGAPVRVADDLYFLTQQGDIMALNALDGRLRWVIPTGITSRVGAAFAGGWVFIGGAQGRMYAYSSP